MNKQSGIATILLGGLAVGMGIASYMYYKKENDEETFKPVTAEDMKQKKIYFHKIINLKEVLMNDESRTS